MTKEVKRREASKVTRFSYYFGWEDPRNMTVKELVEDYLINNPLADSKSIGVAMELTDLVETGGSTPSI